MVLATEVITPLSTPSRTGKTTHAMAEEAVRNMAQTIVNKTINERKFLLKAGHLL